MSELPRLRGLETSLPERLRVAVFDIAKAEGSLARLLIGREIGRTIDERQIGDARRAIETARRYRDELLAMQALIPVMTREAAVDAQATRPSEAVRKAAYKQTLATYERARDALSARSFLHMKKPQIKEEGKRVLELARPCRMVPAAKEFLQDMSGRNHGDVLLELL